jgi:hypothetical protein
MNTNRTQRSEESVPYPGVLEFAVWSGDRELEEKENRLVLLPIRVDDTVMQIDVGWAADIRRQRHIGDFTQWKEHDAYQQAFTRLLKNLKAEGRQPQG